MEAGPGSGESVSWDLHRHRGKCSMEAEALLHLLQQPPGLWMAPPGQQGVSKLALICSELEARIDQTSIFWSRD